MRLSALSCLLAAIAHPLAVSAGVNFPLALGHSDVTEATDASTPPNKDPFYKAPKGFESAPHGGILRRRKVPHPLRVGPSLQTGYYKEAYQLLYRTNDGLGKPSVAVQTLIVPKGANPKKLLSYQTFYDSADNNCSPSYTLQAGQSDLNIEGAIISAALRQGWYVTVSDYEGTDAAFTVGHQAGHATLDGIRATLNTNGFSGLAKHPKVALFGYSGGALASEWAMELQPKYAPDLKIEGAAFGGLTPNVTNVIITVNDTPNSNLIPTGILGFGNQYKNVTAFLKKALVPSKSKEFHIPLHTCNTGKLSNKNILGFFKKQYQSLDAPIITSTVNQNGIMGRTNTPKIPLYIYKSEGDEVSPIKDTDQLVHKYCKDGATIRYIRNKFGTHETEFIVALPYALEWVKARLNGESVKKGCSTREENISKLKPSQKKILGATLYQELKSELAQMSS